MITVLIGENQEKIKELILQSLSKVGNTNIGIVKQADTIKIFDKESLKDMVTLKEKIIELEDSLFKEKQGALYKTVLEAIERPLIEHILERAEGNQLKAARILGINRNTMRAKIKKMGINPEMYKH